MWIVIGFTLSIFYEFQAEQAPVYIVYIIPIDNIDIKNISWEVE